MMKTTAIRIEGLGKRFGREQAVDNVSFSQEEGEYLCLLGASGSGKTTLLRLVAGLETPESGRILLFGRDVTCLKPHERGAPMVFQHPSLWPHMSVLEQILFGLEERGDNRGTSRRLASSAIERVDLAGLENRRPGELSGGQQQRVALARALALGAKIFLLDEPLANLDAHLKSGMRSLLRSLPAEFGVTILHVTHDREDAFELADRIAILDKGGIVALETPEALYRHPPTAFAASLLGEVNRLPGRIGSDDSDGIAIETGLGLWRARHRAGGLARGSQVTLLFRPESVEAETPGNAGPDRCNRFTGKTLSCRRAGPLSVFKLFAPAENNGQALFFTRYGFRESGNGSRPHDCEQYRVPFDDVAVARDE